MENKDKTDLSGQQLDGNMPDVDTHKTSSRRLVLKSFILGILLVFSAAGVIFKKYLKKNNPNVVFSQVQFHLPPERYGHFHPAETDKWEKGLGLKKQKLIDFDVRSISCSDVDNGLITVVMCYSGKSDPKKKFRVNLWATDTKGIVIASTEEKIFDKRIVSNEVIPQKKYSSMLEEVRDTGNIPGLALGDTTSIHLLFYNKGDFDNVSEIFLSAIAQYTVTNK